MDERIVRFRVGVMVLATMIITFILVVLFSDVRQYLQGNYPVRIKFAEAPGVSVDTPVRKNGIPIGRVTKVELIDDGAMVTAAIHANRELGRDEVCRIKSSLLGGDATLEFVQGPNRAKKGQAIQPDEVVEGVVAGDPLQVLTNLEDDLEQLISSMTTASQDVSKFARRFDTLLNTNDEQIGRILGKTEQTLDSVKSAAESMESVLGDPELNADLKRTLKELPTLFAESREAIKSMKSTLSLADRNLRNMEGFTKPLGERGERLFAQVDRSAAKMDLLLTRLVEFSADLNKDGGSLGKFVNDPELYENLNAAACNIEELTRELRPIVRDARVFTDKIARHPELLGVRGAIKGSTGTK